MSDYSNIMKRHYVYLVQVGSSVRYNEGTYKIGRTSRKFGVRSSEYEKGTEVIFTMMVDDGPTVENMMIENFDKLFVKRLDLGLEYYSGDVNKMLMCITIIIQKRMSDLEAIKQKPVIEHNLKILQDQQLINLINRDVPVLLRNNIEIDNRILNNIEINNIESDSITDIIPLSNETYADKLAETTNNDDIDIFINYIRSTSPKWYKSGTWILSQELYDYFVKITESNIFINVFSKSVSRRISSEHKVRKVNGKSGRYMLLKPIDEL